MSSCSNFQQATPKKASLFAANSEVTLPYHVLSLIESMGCRIKALVVIEKFQATGSGWQTPMDRALQEYLKTHSQSDIERLG